MNNPGTTGSPLPEPNAAHNQPDRDNDARRQQPEAADPEAAEPEAAELALLRGLAVEAPASTFQRFHRRAGIAQGTRTLVEAQVIGFWVVLDTILKRIFRAVNPDTHTNPAPTPSSAPSAIPSAAPSVTSGDRA